MGSRKARGLVLGMAGLAVLAGSAWGVRWVLRASVEDQVAFGPFLVLRSVLLERPPDSPVGAPSRLPQFITHNSSFITRARRAGALWGSLAFAQGWDRSDSGFFKADITGAEIITTVAGTGTRGFAGDGGPATSAQFDDPFAVAVDAGGNLFIADQFNNRIRKVAAGTGIITTVAGSGPTGEEAGGFSGDGGPATSARLNSPQGVAVDGRGNLFIADVVNGRIRKVDGMTLSISTVAGTAFVGGSAFSGDGGPATSAQLNGPRGLALDATGNLYIGDSDNSRIRKVAARPLIPIDGTETITTVAGNGTQGFSGDGGAATSAQLSAPRGVAVDASGNLFIADVATNGRIRKVGVAAPTITGLSVTSGTQGTAVTTVIRGTNLAGATGADFGAGITVSLGANTATSLSVTLTISGSAANGARTFSVTTPAGTGSSGSVTFTVVASASPPPPPPPAPEPPPPPAPPRVTSVSPTSGVQGEVVRTDICGDNLGGASFNFGFDITGTLRGVGPNCLTFELSIGTTAVTGAHLILVNGAGGTATFTFTVVRRPDPPVIQGLTVSEGVQGATVMTTITGTGLANATRVDFGGQITVGVVENTDVALKVMLTIPTDADRGSRSFSVTTKGGIGGSGSIKFTVLPRPPVPVIQDLTLREGAQGTTVVTTIMGTSLANATQADLGPGVSVTRGTNTDTSLQVTLVIDRSAPLGSRTVSVTTMGGTGSNAIVAFTVNRPGAGGPRPSITSPADGSRLPIAPNRVTFAWTPVEGAATYGLEFTGSGNPFPQLAGTSPHPGGMGFLVLGTSLTTVIPANAPAGQYQFRVIAFSDAGEVIGTWSDPVTVEVR